MLIGEKRSRNGGQKAIGKLFSFRKVVAAVTVLIIMMTIKIKIIITMNALLIMISITETMIIILVLIMKMVISLHHDSNKTHYNNKIDRSPQR